MCVAGRGLTHPLLDLGSSCLGQEHRHASCQSEAGAALRPEPGPAAQHSTAQHVCAWQHPGMGLGFCGAWGWDFVGHAPCLVQLATGA